MRRLLITLGFPPTYGGMQSYLYTRCLAAAPREIIVLAPAVDGHRAFDYSQPFEVYRWPSKLALVPGLECIVQTGLPLIYALALHRLYRFELIECGQALPLGLIAWLFKQIFGVPYLIYAYGREILRPQQYPFLRTILRIILREAALVICVSEHTRQVVLQVGVPPTRVRVLYPSVDVTRFHPNIDGSYVITQHGLRGKRILLTVSRLVERKGIDIVLYALPCIREVIPNVVYLIVGDGPDRKRLEALAQTLDVKEAVRFIGWVSDELLPAYYAACDVFILLSRSIPEIGEVEGFGIVYLEAGACGKPVIAGRSGGVMEAVQDGVNGLLVEPKDVQAVCQAVIRVLKNPALAHQLGEAGRQRAQHFGNWQILTL